MNPETVTVPVNVTLPVLIPSDNVVETAPLPAYAQHLVDTGYCTKEEAVAFLQWNTVINGLAASADEFFNLYREVRKNYDQQNSRIAVPQNKIIVPGQ